MTLIEYEGKEVDYADNPEYQKWMEELELECECCPVCWDVPCAGCMAGGICDSMCICGQDGDEDDESCFDED